MAVISLTMLIIVVAAVLVVTYFAYPQRGRSVPRFPRLGTAMERAATRLGIDEADSERPKSRL
jgi:hypothetical protein